MSQGNSKTSPAPEKAVIHEHEEKEKKKKTENLKQYWTEHRITLIAYEAQYVYAKKPDEFHDARREEVEPKKKGARKKVNLQYESGFLSICQEDSEEIKVMELAKDYDELQSLFFGVQDENRQQIRQFVKIMLELKHSGIVKEFCEIYNMIVKEVFRIQFNQIYKEEPRFQFLEEVKNKLLTLIDSNKEKFPYFVGYLREDEKETKKLLVVECYCFLAEKFYFNINEFYSEAFSVSFDSNPSKKVKKG